MDRRLSITVERRKIEIFEQPVLAFKPRRLERITDAAGVGDQAFAKRDKAQRAGCSEGIVLKK